MRERQPRTAWHTLCDETQDENPGKHLESALHGGDHRLPRTRRICAAQVIPLRIGYDLFSAGFPRQKLEKAVQFPAQPIEERAEQDGVERADHKKQEQ